MRHLEFLILQNSKSHRYQLNSSTKRLYSIKSITSIRTITTSNTSRHLPKQRYPSSISQKNYVQPPLTPSSNDPPSLAQTAASASSPSQWIYEKRNYSHSKLVPHQPRRTLFPHDQPQPLPLTPQKEKKIYSQTGQALAEKREEEEEDDEKMDSRRGRRTEWTNPRKVFPFSFFVFLSPK